MSVSVIHLIKETDNMKSGHKQARNLIEILYKTEHFAVFILVAIASIGWCPTGKNTNLEKYSILVLLESLEKITVHLRNKKVFQHHMKAKQMYTYQNYFFAVHHLRRDSRIIGENIFGDFKYNLFQFDRPD